MFGELGTYSWLKETEQAKKNWNMFAGTLGPGVIVGATLFVLPAPATPGLVASGGTRRNLLDHISHQKRSRCNVRCPRTQVSWFFRNLAYGGAGVVASSSTSSRRDGPRTFKGSFVCYRCPYRGQDPNRWQCYLLRSLA